MVYFLSCDWGTSSFRLRLVNADHAEILAVRKSDQGIAATFNSLDESTKKDPQERLNFYLRIIKEHIHAIERERNTSLEGVPVVISGMASSSIGMAELPYGALPFSIEGRGVEAAYYEAGTRFPHPVLLISGVKTEVDVMRGEETQLIGTIADSAVAEGEGLYIFPGTHSKHIEVREGQVIGFKTFMTGEFFELLSEESILKAGVEKNDELTNSAYLRSFREGVSDASGTNLLHMSFRVRTNALFEKRSGKENYHYLSGLLIGSELNALTSSEHAQVYVCSDPALRLRYETALEVLGLKNKMKVCPADRADEAVVRGQLMIYKQYTRSA